LPGALEHIRTIFLPNGMPRSVPEYVHHSQLSMIVKITLALLLEDRMPGDMIESLFNSKSRRVSKAIDVASSYITSRQYSRTNVTKIVSYLVAVLKRHGELNEESNRVFDVLLCYRILSNDDSVPAKNMARKLVKEVGALINTELSSAKRDCDLNDESEVKGSKKKKTSDKSRDTSHK
jgi:hypothetical protein